MLFRKKVGLVLGGGGARGLGHVGVIKVLAREGIPIDFIAGSSMGALIGGIYAQNPDANLLESRVCSFIKSKRFKKLGVNNFRKKSERDPDDLLKQLTHKVKRQLVINFAANRISVLKAERLQIAITSLLNKSNIEDCKIPFACVASDLRSGESVVFRSGGIRPAVEGSSAIPGFLPPVKYKGYYLIDGGVSNNFPVDVVRKMGAKFVIAIDASLDFDTNVKINNVIDLVLRSAQISVRHLDDHLKQHADYVIKPQTGNIHWSEFNRVNEVIEKGEIAAQKAIPKIKSQLRKKRGLISRFIEYTS
jgi:NTE family protein